MVMDNTTTAETDNSTERPAGAVAAVSLKLPPYWPDDPQIWFAQVEAQFSTRGISVEKTKYDYVVSSLQPEYATVVRDLIVSPPKDNPYQLLKAELMRRTSASEQRRLHQLLTAEELGDRTPSQLLRRMEQLLGGKQLEDSIFRQLFLQRLPHPVQTVLASSRDSMTIHQLADLADKIAEVSAPARHCPPRSDIAAAITPQPTSPEPGIQKLADQVQQLTLQVQHLTQHLDQDRGRPAKPSGRGRSRSRSRSRGDRRYKERTHSHAGAECWYHWQYGQDARKCTSPCSWQSQSHPSSNSGNAHANE